MMSFQFLHPDDAAAMEQLNAFPSFKKLVKKFLSIGAENMQYGINMASSIRLSPTQLPEIYNHLPPIYQKLDLEIPEFYLIMDPMPNAYTFGDTRKNITITSSLVEMLDNDEITAVLAHECGHILCHHVLYHSMADFLKIGINALGILDPIGKPIQLAYQYWQRKSELSADRVSAYVTSPEITAKVMARLAGGPASLTQKVNLGEWANQADIYEQIRTEGKFQKGLQILATAWLDHPFAAVRVREVLKWAQTDEYKSLKKANSVLKKCTCGTFIEANWMYCEHCGRKLS